MPSTRNSNTPLRRSSSRKAPETSQNKKSSKSGNNMPSKSGTNISVSKLKTSKTNNNTTIKSCPNIAGSSKDVKGKTGDINSNKSCVSMSSSVSIDTKNGVEKGLPAVSRRKRLENSDVEMPVPTKRSRRSDGETQMIAAKQSAHEVRKTPQSDDINVASSVDKKVLKKVEVRPASNDSLRGVKKTSGESSVDEVQVSRESPDIKDKSQTIPTSVGAVKHKKRGRPSNRAQSVEEVKGSNTPDETPDGKRTKQLDAKTTNSSEKPPEEQCAGTLGSGVGFSPRRSSRAVVPNRRYLETEDNTDKKKIKTGQSSRKVAQKEQKTSPDSSSKSRISRMKNSGEKEKTEDTEHISVPESSVSLGVGQNINAVVRDNKTTGTVKTLHFSKTKLQRVSKTPEVSVCSLNFKRTNEEVSSKKTVLSSSTDVIEPSNPAAENNSTTSTNLDQETVDTEHSSQNSSKNTDTKKSEMSNLEVSSDTSLPASVTTEDESSTVIKPQTVVKDTAGCSQTPAVVIKDAETTMVDTSVSADTSLDRISVSTSTSSRENGSQSVTQTSVANEENQGDSRSPKAAMITTSTGMCNTETDSQSMTPTSLSNVNEKADVKSSIVKTAVTTRTPVTTKMPVARVRGSSTPRPPPDVQTQTIYKVNLDGTSTRTVIILDQEDGSNVKWKSLLKSPSVKTGTELQKEFIEKKEKELASTEVTGSQSDTVSSDVPAVTATSLVKEVSVESSRVISSCNQSATGANLAVPVTPGKIQKATTRQNIPDTSENLPPFIKVISYQSDGQQTELSKTTSVSGTQIVKQSSTSDTQDPRVFTMDARTKRAVASILSLESGITFSSSSNTEETANDSSSQESDVMTVSVDACTDESVVLPISQTSSSETLTIQSLGDEPNKPVSGEASQMSMTAEASSKPATDAANPTDEMDQVNGSDLTALWSDILETNTVTSSSVSETGSADHSKSKYVTCSTQTPIEPAEEKIIIPSVYKSSVIDISHIKKECEEEGGEDDDKQRLVVVQLPEGAVVTRPVVNSRYKYDDTPFLDENYVDIFRCKICCYETKKKPNWYKHKQKHLGLRPHACTLCQYRAATASNLKRHLAIHADIRNFMCQLCGMYFRQKIHLDRHIKYKHEVKQVKCPLCDYMCANENPDLKVHIKRKHFTGELMESSMKAFTCPECSLIALSKKDLRQHMKFHKQGPELKLFCEHCSFVTDCDSRLRRHMFIHTKEKPFQCGMCEYRGSQKEHVLRHMRNVHHVEIQRRQRKQSTSSQLIEGGQISMAALSKLIDRNDYTCRDKIFACNHCSMKFSKLLNLYKHLYTQHESIMPPQKDDEFGCVVCDFQTNTKKNLLVHMRKHNMHDHNPPSHVYSCVLCRYQNPKRRNLFQHMKKKHHIEIVMKEDGTTSCFIEDSSTLPDDLDQNLMTVGDIVTTTTTHFDNEVDDSEYRNVISIQNFASMVAPQPTAINDGEGNLIIDTEISSIQDVQTTHTDAAEAIEGLQALAQQGVVEVGEVVEGEEQLVTLPDPPAAVKTESSVEDDLQQEDKQSIQLTADQLVNLSSGDYVEINGEVYKVEISAENKQQAISAENIELEEVTCVD